MKKKDGARRSFLKGVLAGSAAVAVSAVSSKSARAGTTTLKKRTGEILYRETEDFKRYYETL